MKLSNALTTFAAATLLATSLNAFAGALSVTKEITVNASPETTWKMIGDFNHLDVWHPVVIGSTLTQGNKETAGAIRVLTLGNGATITEELLSHNNANNTYSYAITESPLPVAGYVSEISVSATEDGKSKVTWTASFDAKGVADEEAVNTISGVYDAGLGSLQKHFQ